MTSDINRRNMKKTGKYCSFCGTEMVMKKKKRFNTEDGSRVTFLECPNYKPRKTIRILLGIQEFHDTDDVDKWDL